MFTKKSSIFIKTLFALYIILYTAAGITGSHEMSRISDILGWGAVCCLIGTFVAALILIQPETNEVREDETK